MLCHEIIFLHQLFIMVEGNLVLCHIIFLHLFIMVDNEGYLCIDQHTVACLKSCANCMIHYKKEYNCNGSFVFMICNFIFSKSNILLPHKIVSPHQLS